MMLSTSPNNSATKSRFETDATPCQTTSLSHQRGCKSSRSRSQISNAGTMNSKTGAMNSKTGTIISKTGTMNFKPLTMVSNTNSESKLRITNAWSVISKTRMMSSEDKTTKQPKTWSKASDEPSQADSCRRLKNGGRETCYSGRCDVAVVAVVVRDQFEQTMKDERWSVRTQQYFFAFLMRWILQPNLLCQPTLIFRMRPLLQVSKNEYVDTIGSIGQRCCFYLW